MSQQRDLRSRPDYWFPAKRYGWGWGLPARWEGWLVLVAYVALVVLGAFMFPPRFAPASYVGYLAGLCVLLIGICWLKGEPARWRWGDTDRS